MTPSPVDSIAGNDSIAEHHAAQQAVPVQQHAYLQERQAIAAVITPLLV